MALLRRCSRVLWTRTRFLNLNEKCISHIINDNKPTDKSYFPNLQAQVRAIFQNEAIPQSDRLENEGTNDSLVPQALLYPRLTSGMCYADLKKIIDTKLRVLPNIDESFGLRLLESCRDMLPDTDLAARHQLVQEAWDLLENLGYTLTVDHYNVLLSIYAQNSQYLNAEVFLKTMKATPNKDTYRLLLDAVAELGDYSQVLTIMAKIKDMGYPINKATFNSLILAYSVNGDINGARSVLDTMQAANVELNIASYCALARGYAAQGDLSNLTWALKNRNLKLDQLMLVAKSLIKSGHSKYISDIMKYLPVGIDAKQNDVVRAIIELTHLRKAKDAFKIINCLPVPDTPTGSSAGFTDFFLNELVKSETPMGEIIEICENLMSSAKNPFALLKVAEAALRLKKTDFALQAFQALQNQDVEIRPHFYWPLLINAASSQGETDVIKLVEHMIANKVYLDDETLTNYIIPFLSAKDPLIIVRQLQDCGIQISQLLTPLLANLLSKGNLKGAVTLTEKITGKVNDKYIIEPLLQAYIVTRNVNATAQLLSNINCSSDQNGDFLMKLMANERVTVDNEELGAFVLTFDKMNLKISRTSAKVLESRIARLMEPENLSEIFRRSIDIESDTVAWTPIPHPRVMTLEELENHLADLTTNGMNTRGVLRKLLQGHCSKNNLKKAEEVAKIFTNKGFSWTKGMISSMFYLYASNNMLDEADIRYRELKEKHKEFRIDDHKIIDYATVLVKSNKLDRALEVLGEQKTVRCGEETIRNCWNLLNAVAASGSSENVKRTLSVLIDKGYCKISNHVLGPLVRTHLLKNDLQSAVAEFKECARIYNKLPLKQELLRAIIQTCTDELDAQNQLTEVLTLIESGHGEAAANEQLFMALAATNKEKELHKLIKMSPTVNQTLKASAQRLTDENNLPALQTILKACRTLQQPDKMIIYNSILTLCSRSGDYKTALVLWEKMQSEDVRPTLAFIEKLKTLLNSQQVPLPSELLSIKKKKRG